MQRDSHNDSLLAPIQVATANADDAHASTTLSTSASGASSTRAPPSGPGPPLPRPETLEDVSHDHLLRPSLAKGNPITPTGFQQIVSTVLPMGLDAPLPPQTTAKGKEKEKEPDVSVSSQRLSQVSQVSFFLSQLSQSSSSLIVFLCQTDDIWHAALALTFVCWFR
jgi:hypothetical protein